MGRILGGGSSVRPPAPQPPPAVPELGVESRDWSLRRARRGSGFEQTILTGDLSPVRAGKTTLG